MSGTSWGSQKAVRVRGQRNLHAHYWHAVQTGQGDMEEGLREEANCFGAMRCRDLHVSCPSGLQVRHSLTPIAQRQHDCQCAQIFTDYLC